MPIKIVKALRLELADLEQRVINIKRLLATEKDTESVLKLRIELKKVLSDKFDVVAKIYDAEH